MQCTNYSAEPFKTIVQQYNHAAADFVASVMETDEFKKWYGRTELPKNNFFENINGHSWNVYELLHKWQQQHEEAAGFNNQEYKMNEPGVQEKLAAKVEAYNKDQGPFTAHVGRSFNDKGEEVYHTYLASNKNYNKEAARNRIAVDPTEKTHERINDQHLFHMNREVSAEELRSNDRIALREEALKEGIYKIGDSYYRVKLRSGEQQSLKQSGISQEEMKRRLLNDEGVSTKFRNEFLSGRLPMFLYDITRATDTNIARVRALPDFVGAMPAKASSKAPGARFVTGYTDVDKYMKVLLEHQTILKGQRTTEKGNVDKLQQLNSQISAISSMMERLKKDPTVDAINAVGRSMMMKINRDMELATTPVAIQEGLRLAKAWTEIGKVLDLDPKSPTEEDLATIKEAKAVRDMAATLFDSYFKKYVNSMVDMIDSNLKASADGSKRSAQVVNEEGNIVLTDIDFGGAMTITGEFSGNAIEQLEYKLLTHIKDEANDESYAFENRMHEAVKALNGKDAHDVKPEELKFLFTKDAFGNQALVKKYDDSFYKELYTKQYQAFKNKSTKSEAYVAAIALGATQEELKKLSTPKEYYEFERQHYDYVLHDKGRVEFENHMQHIKESLFTEGVDEKGDQLYDKKKYDQIYKEYDPEAFPKWLNKEKGSYFNKGSYWYTKELKPSIALSKEYRAMNEKQKAFYNFFTKEFIDGQHEFIKDFKYNETDMDRQLIGFVLDAGADLKGKLGYMGNQFKDFLKGIAGVKYNVDDVSHETTQALTDRPHISVQFKNIDQFIPDGAKIGEVNPLHILDQFVKAGNLFKQKKAMEGVLNMINDLTLHADKAEVTNANKYKKDILGKILTTHTNTNLANRISFSIESNLTDKTADPYKINTKNPTPGFNFSAEKALDSLNNYTRFRMMALAPLSAAGNVIMGMINNFTYAADGRYFSDGHLANALWIMKATIAHYWGKPLRWATGGALTLQDRNAIKVAELLRRYRVIGDVTEKNIHHSELMSWFFTLNESGEFMNQGATAVAQMLKQKITLKNGTERNLYDMYDVDNNGQVFFHNELLDEGSEWNSKEKINHFFEVVRKVNGKIHGDYENRMLAKKTVLGRALLTFRTWLPMALKDRFGGEYQDEVLGAEKGRYISAFEVLKKGAKGAFSHNWADAADAGKFIAKVMLPFFGHKIHFSDQMKEVDVHNLNMMVREIHFFMSILGSVMALKSALADPDNEEEQSMLRYLYNQMQRAQAEMGFYFFPSETMQIVRDVVPLSSTLQEGSRVITRSYNYLFDPDNDIYKAGIRQGKSKFITAVEEFAPVTRAAQKTWAATAQAFSNAQYK